MIARLLCFQLYLGELGDGLSAHRALLAGLLQLLRTLVTQYQVVARLNYGVPGAVVTDEARLFVIDQLALLQAENLLRAHVFPLDHVSPPQQNWGEFLPSDQIVGEDCDHIWFLNANDQRPLLIQVVESLQMRAIYRVFEQELLARRRVFLFEDLFFEINSEKLSLIVEFLEGPLKSHHFVLLSVLVDQHSAVEEGVCLRRVALSSELLLQIGVNFYFEEILFVDLDSLLSLCQVVLVESLLLVSIGHSPLVVCLLNEVIPISLRSWFGLHEVSH